VIIGTAGHVDHGKTSLVRALTGVDTDRLKEEKARGISIDLGFAYAPTSDGSVLAFVDVPGHERFVHNMLAGASGIDYVLLVVAADDGVMPQTVEHLAIIDLLGIARGVVALSKIDLVTPSRRAAVAADIARLVAGTALAGVALVELSTVTGEGLEALRAELHAAARAIEARSHGGRFRLAVDRSFVLPGAGTIVTGTILSGEVATGDKVVVSPSGLAARVRSIHAENRPAERGRAGERCALNVVGDGVSKEAIARGDVVLDPELHAPTTRIDAELRVLASEPKAIRQWMPVRFHHGATEVGGRVVLLGDEPIASGSRGWVQLVLDRPIAAAAGDRYVLRDTSAKRTIGGGRLLDLRAPARRRRTPERVAQLRALATADPERSLVQLLDGPPGYVDLVAFARDRALRAGELAVVAERLGLVRFAGKHGVVYVLAPKAWTGLRQALTQTLATFHRENPDLQGIGRERLRVQLELRLPERVFAAVLERLVNEGAVVIAGAWVRLPSHEARLGAEQEALWARVRPALAGKERFRPPRVRDIAGILGAPEAGIRRLLKLASRMGMVDEVAHDHFFLRDTVAEIVEILHSVAAETEGGRFAAAALRDRLENGRKVTIQILEFFDRYGVTLRHGDLRHINPHRFDLFARTTTGRPEATTAKGREPSPVGRPDFKSGKDCETALGGFDPHSLPPARRGRR
jgi:selenocysteine-specific elongation factor